MKPVLFHRKGLQVSSPVPLAQILVELPKIRVAVCAHAPLRVGRDLCLDHIFGVGKVVIEAGDGDLHVGRRSSRCAEPSGRAEGCEREWRGGGALFRTPGATVRDAMSPELLEVLCSTIVSKDSSLLEEKKYTEGV